MSYEKLTSSSPEAQSESPVADHVNALASLFPSVVREGKVDFDALRQMLGDDVAKDDELFGLQWKGKAQARRAATTPSLGTLRPCKEESVDWETTKNLYIEGDNLEVLKLLRKSYAGKVKMIYIDPPYNTGKEFVYPDNYQNGIEEYKKLTGQLGCFKANAETSGRFHTDWLNMMYPRLALAKDLLSDDGVICISIDDNEITNLRAICNEIFCEINIMASFIIVRSEGGGLAKKAVIGHDYCLVYAKNSSMCSPLGRPKDIRGKRVTKNGEDYWIETDWFREVFGKYGTCHYEDIVKFYDESKKEEIDQGIRDGIFTLIKKQDGRHIVGRYRKIADDTSKFYTVLKHLNKNGVADLKELNLSEYFDYPKPTSLVKEFCLGSTIKTKNKKDIVLDFFSGSATTADAVMQLNSEDEGNRRFIMIQLPEPCDEKSEALKAGFETISDIGKERIRRAGKKIKEEAGLQGQHLDIGFRVYKLDSSNLRVWNPEADDLELTLGSYEKHLLPGRTQEDLLYEILLKQGIELTEDARIRELGGKRVYSLGHGQYYACMETVIPSDQIEPLRLGLSSGKMRNLRTIPSVPFL